MARQRRRRPNRVKYWAVLLAIKDTGEDNNGLITYEERVVHRLPYKTAEKAGRVGLSKLIRRFGTEAFKRPGEDWFDVRVMVLNTVHRVRG